MTATARAGPAEDASEAVAERRTVEGVEERVDGRVGVAQPQSQLVETVIDRRCYERLDNEHAEVGNPADRERHHH